MELMLIVLEHSGEIVELLQNAWYGLMCLEY